MNIKEQNFCGAKINYPVNINLKVIMNNTFPDVVNRTHIGIAIEDAGLNYNEIQVNQSKSMNYFSYTILLNVESELLMNNLYEKIRKIPGFVMAI
jgi:putative lipoic acid-binding regulatory protein